jgi:hypothetical protein
LSKELTSSIFKKKKKDDEKKLVLLAVQPRIPGEKLKKKTKINVFWSRQCKYILVL